MSTGNTYQVEVENLVKEFGDLKAVDNINLQINEGEFFSLLGPSGCGKTTTLRIISGFEQPTEGAIKLGGINATETPPNKRDTNLVFQHLSLFPHMTVAENIGYGLKKSGMKKRERDDRIAQYLELVDLEGFEDRKPSELSGGQQQRVALARSLVNQPGVLLLDEPLASLDRNLRKHMEVELSRIQQNVNSAFFYVTHDQEVAMTLSDRLAVMNDGKIEQVGTPQEVYHDPANRFVADFIGDSNFFDGTAHGTPQEMEIRLGVDDGPAYTTNTDVPEGVVSVGIRPENIGISNSDSGDWTGTVTEQYFQGDHTRFVVDSNISDQPVDIVVQGDYSSITPGTSVALDTDGESLMVFE